MQKFISGINIPDPQHCRFRSGSSVKQFISFFLIIALRLSNEQGAMSLSSLGDLTGTAMNTGTAMTTGTAMNTGTALSVFFSVVIVIAGG
jgi:hypothetical protein